jgi:IS30 family transposase
MKYQYLNESQRYGIKAYLKCDISQKFIAEQLGVSESRISRELKWNKLKRGSYNPQKAQESTIKDKSR